MGTRFAPKPTLLQGEPTPTQLEAWINNLLFNLTIDGSFEEFLAENFTWSPSTVVNRGLVDDTEGPTQRTARQKVAYLNLMLGSIHSYAPVVSKRFITEEAGSLNEIWDRLRTRFGCRKTGSLILELTSLTLEPNESYEALWERVISFIEGNLISVGDRMQHLGAVVQNSEVMTPTLMNISIVLWLRIIHPSLPAVVRQRYATELRNKSISSIRDEISDSLNSLLSDLAGSEEGAISRAYKPYNSSFQRKQSGRSDFGKGQRKSCVICLTAKRPAEHFLSECPFLPDSDRRFMKSRTRMVEVDDDDETFEEELSSSTRRIDIEASPEFHMLCDNTPVKSVLDSGAESNLIAKRYAIKIGAKIQRTNATARGPNGAKLTTVGEVHLKFERYPHKFQFNGLVVEDLNDDVLAGIPFLSLNDIYVRPAKRTIHIGDKEVIKYEPAFSAQHSTNRNVSIVLRVPHKIALLPGDVAKFPVPVEFHNEAQIAVEPRMITASMNADKVSSIWLKPQMLCLQNKSIELVNHTDRPVLLRKHEQVANVRMISTPEESESINAVVSHPTISHKSASTSNAFRNVEVDPGNRLSPEVKQQFKDLHAKHSDVFDDTTIGLYNGYSGPLEVKVNMGPTLPPQRKGRMPLYNRKLQEEYQEVCDSLEGSVLVKPEDAGVTIEYLNPSFLIRKPSGKKRLVTAFGEVGQYAKPQPALMPDTRQVIRAIGNWLYILKSDMSSSYFQMKLAKESMKYCGIVTPFKGIRVYARGAMGMPGTETALEELLSRVLGHLITAGGVVKIADDLFVGGSTPEEVLEIWAKVLQSLQDNGLKLAASKTICCPTSVTVLGWIWSEGTLQASPHRISALEAVEPPSTVGKLRSYIGSYKFLSKVIPSYSDVLSPLEDEVAGRNSTEKIVWLDSLIDAFKHSQKQLTTATIITLPKREDQLQIVTDASKSGIAATLFVIRKNKPLIAGFFNAKLRKHQCDWLPCELEALCIGAAVRHFGLDIINNMNQVTVLTDSRPCVQSFEKLCRGEFSASARVATFLSIISRFQVKLLHIKGSDNVLTDYASRNPLDCPNSDCQICQFIKEVEDSVVRPCSVRDVIDSHGSVPFSTRKAWLDMQQSCRDLRRTAAHLKQGTTPSKKETKKKDVKRYLQNVRIAKDGLLIVYHQDPLHPSTQKIVVPRTYLHGLLVSLHLKLQHPSKTQMRKVFSRAFYALDSDKALTEVSNNCHTCVSLQNMPNRFFEQSTSVPKFIGSHFAADVLKRACQVILVVRENVSAYTAAKLIANEQAETLKEGLLIVCSQLRSVCGPTVHIRVDPAPGWRSLVATKPLKNSGLEMVLGEEKNSNKNPIADKAICELHAEINRIDPEGGKISDVTLALAISNLNDRIRDGGLSAREMWTKRDQFTGKQLPINDEKEIAKKHSNRMKAHKSSAKYQARGKTEALYPDVSVGDLVYINSDRSKLKPRDKYIVVKPKDNTTRSNTVSLQKFVGSQLRSRIYVVNLADITKVPVDHIPSVLESYPCSEDEEDDHATAQMNTDVSSVSDDEENLPTDDESSDEVFVFPAEQAPQRMSPVVPQQPRRSGRERHPPKYLQSYVCEKEQ